MKGKVLLVEDEDDTRQLLGRALERAGYVALLASNAAAGADRARLERPDVIVTDIVLGSDDRGAFPATKLPSKRVTAQRRFAST